MTRFLSFADLQFEPDPGITGFTCAPVVAHERCHAKFWRVPPGWGLRSLGIEENLHFHRRAWEYAIHLSGDFPHIEYDDAKREKVRIRFGAGDLMIRPPTSIHGLHADMTVQAGSEMLYWNTGPGTSIRDPEYHAETTDVLGDPGRFPFDPVNRARIDRREQLRPPGEGIVVREVSRAGEPLRVTLRWVPAGRTVPLADVIGPDGVFAVLWDGDAHVEGAGATGRAELRRWTTLVGAPDDSQRAATLLATSATCWLSVASGA